VATRRSTYCASPPGRPPCRRAGVRRGRGVRHLRIPAIAGWRSQSGSRRRRSRGLAALALVPARACPRCSVGSTSARWDRRREPSAWTRRRS